MIPKVSLGCGSTLRVIRRLDTEMLEYGQPARGLKGVPENCWLSGFLEAMPDSRREAALALGINSMCVCNDVETCGCKNIAVDALTVDHSTREPSVAVVIAENARPATAVQETSYARKVFINTDTLMSSNLYSDRENKTANLDVLLAPIKYECPLGTYNEGPPNYWYNRHQALGYSAAPSAIPEELCEPQYHPYNPVLEDAYGEEEDTDWETTAADLSQCRPCPNTAKLYRKDMRGATNVDDCRRWECRDDDFGISRALPGVPNCRVACENFRRSEAGGSMKDPKVEEIYCPVSCGYCAASPSQPTCPVTIKSAAVLSSVWSLAIPTIALFMHLGM
ncbi:hypothetical protein FOL46_006829 [Perkinsus olseni]|uniref:Uncharacterized protein n=1 Tax=Perkinsus olseni TaxID=32597 RepID=A0A7J6MPV1_PEROL|nr:hypothetical protein FOL46_006829 [Perkinsus olseni]